MSMKWRRLVFDRLLLGPLPKPQLKPLLKPLVGMALEVVPAVAAVAVIIVNRNFFPYGESCLYVYDFVSVFRGMTFVVLR